MLKFAGRSHDRPLVGLGLSFENLARLKKGQPLTIDGKDLGVDCEILIFAGEDEEAMANELREIGLLPPEVEIKQPQPGERHEWRRP